MHLKIVMNKTQRDFLDQAAAEAEKAAHPFPKMAACEAALESGWGHSELARDGHNLFGMKQHAHEVYGTMALPTREFLEGEWKVVTAVWVSYPDWHACFADRLATLQRLSNVYPHYKAALDAQDVVQYISEVSKTWSTDPSRADKCLAIYRDYAGSSDVLP
jgi:flagellum-specific peptidoglycan hydrolase FlgJ